MKILVTIFATTVYAWNYVTTLINENKIQRPKIKDKLEDKI